MTAVVWDLMVMLCPIRSPCTEFIIMFHTQLLEYPKCCPWCSPHQRGLPWHLWWPPWHEGSDLIPPPDSWPSCAAVNRDIRWLRIMHLWRKISSVIQLPPLRGWVLGRASELAGHGCLSVLNMGTVSRLLRWSSGYTADIFELHGSWYHSNIRMHHNLIWQRSKNG